MKQGGAPELSQLQSRLDSRHSVIEGISPQLPSSYTGDASLAVQYFLGHRSMQQYSPGLPLRQGAPITEHSSANCVGSLAVQPTRFALGQMKPLEGISDWAGLELNSNVGLGDDRGVGKSVIEMAGAKDGPASDSYVIT